VRKGDSGNDVRYDFCPQCGTTIRWQVAMIADRVVFAGGAFDDMSALKIAGEMYAEFKMAWVKLGCDLSVGQAPDDKFRAALTERSSAFRRA
jgi:hypothetical protein